MVADLPSLFAEEEEKEDNEWRFMDVAKAKKVNLKHMFFNEYDDEDDGQDTNEDSV